MSSSIRDQMKTDLPKGWWRSARWWGSTAVNGVVSGLMIVAPALLLNQAVYAVRHRRDRAKLARLNGEGFSYGLVASVVLVAALVWSTAGIPEFLPILLGMGAFLALNAAVAGTVVGVLAASGIGRRRADDVRGEAAEAIGAQQ